MNACLWCDDPCEGKLCKECNTCPKCDVPVTEHPLFHCKADPRHTVPTIGHSCAECDNIAHMKALRAKANAPIIESLKAIRAQHIADWHRPWPGMEFGKGMFGMMLDKAIEDLS